MVVASVVEVVEGAMDGAGDALVLFGEESRDEGVFMIARAKQTLSPSPSHGDESCCYGTRAALSMVPVAGHLELRVNYASRAMTKLGLR